MEVLAILHGLEKFHHYYFARNGKFYNRLQTTGSNLKIGCGHVMTEITVHTTQDPLIQSKFIIQTWTRSVHSRLAVKK